MDFSKIPIGRNPPSEVNVVIEIPMGGNPVKYEFDKVSGAMYVDRFLHTAMYYPCNYGFVPHTLSDDGDPIDAAVLSQFPVQAGVVIPSRPVGVLLMEDESGIDEKLLCVPLDDLHPYYGNIKSLGDVRPVLLDQISHFFEHYKDLEPEKWAKVQGWESQQKACALIEEAIERALSADNGDT
jgi:inorganic pyrophosphatase